jgi:ribbon-helix-helix CopG family protein
MRAISLHVEDDVYRKLKSLAEGTGRPVAELIRDAMAEYLARQGGRGRSIFDLPPHPSGALLRPWTREELLDEMREL